MNLEAIETGEFFFDPQDFIYVDHFPGNPVVPGSLIIDAFRRAACGSENGDSAVDIENFRFKRFIRPGRYAYRLQMRADARIGCTLYDKGQTVVTGNLILPGLEQASE